MVNYCAERRENVAKIVTIFALQIQNLYFSMKITDQNSKIIVQIAS